MRIRIAIAVLAGLATSALMSGAAMAAPSPSTSPSTSSSSTTVTLNPSSVARGGSVLVGGGCWGSYGKPATAQSTAFGTVTLNPMDGGPGARVTIGKDVKPGKHVVNVRCADGATGAATLTVLGSQTKTKPVGGVQTGGGGTAGGAPSHLWAGLVPLAGLGGLGVGFVLLRRRARRA